jgi:uncharacterized surface protein with fasciclin (FAS1) repeats
MKKLILSLLIVGLAGTACSSAQKVEDATADATEKAGDKMEEKAEEKAAESQTIVAVAAGAGTFNTLVAAVTAAELVATLNSPGPFTVFAPTDEAFAALPAGTVDELLKPENKAKLTAILTYHVVPGKVMAADVTTMEATTVNGADASVVVGDAGVTYAGANVTKTDITASNGVIHVIDAVVMPPADDAEEMDEPAADDSM